MSGSVTIIDGISNAGKTTFCDYMKTHGYFIIEEAPVFLKNNKNIGTLSATVPNNLEEEKKNQEVLFEAEIERLKMAGEYAKNEKNVIMDRSFLSTVAMAYALEKDLPFKGAYDYSKELEKKYFKEIQNLSKIVNINFLFFDVNRDILIERNQKRNKKNMEQVKTENTTYQNLCVCVLSNFRCVRLSAKICKYSKRSSKKKVYCDKLLH